MSKKYEYNTKTLHVYEEDWQELKYLAIEHKTSIKDVVHKLLEGEIKRMKI